MPQLAIKTRKSRRDWHRLAVREVRRALKVVGVAPPVAEMAVDVAIVGETQMKALNRKFRGKARPTDVLSFPAHEILKKSGRLGELAICLPVCRRQAKEQGHSPERELRILVVHGVLHLLGFDHERSARAAAEMARAEARLLAGGHKAGLIARTRAG